MNGSIKLSGEYSFVCDRVEISLDIDGVTINSVYRYVTQEGIAGSLLESSDHPIISLFTESNKDRMVSDADEDFYERYIDAVEALDGQAGPTIDQTRTRTHHCSELYDALNDLDFADSVAIGSALQAPIDQALEELDNVDSDDLDTYQAIKSYILNCIVDSIIRVPAGFQIAIPDHQIRHLLNVLADVCDDLENQTFEDYDLGPKSTLNQVQILSEQFDTLFSRHLGT
mgnify:CR=1 FL=1